MRKNPVTKRVREEDAEEERSERFERCFRGRTCTEGRDNIEEAGLDWAGLGGGRLFLHTEPAAGNATC